MKLLDHSRAPDPSVIGVASATDLTYSPTVVSQGVDRPDREEGQTTAPTSDESGAVAPAPTPGAAAGAPGAPDAAPATAAGAARPAEAAPAAARGVGHDDRTRTRAPAGNDTDPPAPPLARPRLERLPAPLQYRDPQRYQIVAEHGRGGLGRVYRARDKELGRDVALKELLHRGTSSELRFFREALITARLEHPGIVPIHEAGRWPDGTPFYSMKLVAGRPLKELIDDCKTLEDRLALLPNVIAVADAIAYAHDHNIIHRDLKPSNVIVGEFGETVVIDWGLAKDIAAGPNEPAGDPTPIGPYRAAPTDDGVTVAGTILGTPAYMSPEQARGEAVDERADIYAIGAILHHLLEGAAPPGGDVDVPHSRLVGRARDLHRIILKARNRNPLERYQSCVALAADLRAFTANRPIAARRYSIVQRLLLSFVRNRLLGIVVLGAMSLLIITLAFALVSTRAERRAALRAGHDAVDARQQLLERHAILLLETDPTEALETVASMPKGSPVLGLVVAEARRRGVAAFHARLHSHRVIDVNSTSDGTIVSVGHDAAVLRTSAAGETSAAVRMPAGATLYALNAASTVLIYQSGEKTVTTHVLATNEEQHVALPFAPTLLAVASSGERFAAYGDSGAIATWTSGAAALTVLAGDPATTAMEFLHDEALLTLSPQSIVTFHGPVQRIEAKARQAQGYSSAEQRIALHHADGAVSLFALPTLTYEQQVRPCSTAGIVDIAISRSGLELFFACDTGDFGVLDIATARATLMGRSPDRIMELFIDPSGSRVAVRSTQPSLLVHDRSIGASLVLRGHRQAITAVNIADSVILTGDSSGEVRAWRLQDTVAKRIDSLPGRIMDVEYHWRTRGFYAVSSGGVLRAYGRDGTRANSVDGLDAVFAVYSSPAAADIVTLDVSGAVQWRDDIGLGVRHSIAGNGTLGRLAFSDDRDLALFATERGGISLVNASSGSVRALRVSPNPISALSPRVVRGSYVYATYTGDVVRADLEGGVDIVHRLKSVPTMLTATPDGGMVAIGTATGEVEVLRDVFGTAKFTRVAELSMPIHHLAFSSSGQELAIIAEDGSLTLLTSRGTLGPPRVAFTIAGSLIRARIARFSPDESVLSIARSHGGICFYELDHSRWTCDGQSSGGITSSTISSDGNSLIAGDLLGDVYLYNIPRTLSHR